MTNLLDQARHSLEATTKHHRTDSKRMSVITPIPIRQLQECTSQIFTHSTPISLGLFLLTPEYQASKVRQQPMCITWTVEQKMRIFLRMSKRRNVGASLGSRPVFTQQTSCTCLKTLLSGSQPHHTHTRRLSALILADEVL